MMTHSNAFKRPLDVKRITVERPGYQTVRNGRINGVTTTDLLRRLGISR